MGYNVVEYKKGETIVKQGERGTLMFLVQGGEVEVLQELGDSETKVATLGRSDFFGEMSLLENEPRTHSVRALSDAKIIQIDRQDLEQMLRRNPDIAVRMVKKLSVRLESTADLYLRAVASQEAMAHGVTEKVVSGEARLVAIVEPFEASLPKKKEVKIGRIDPVNNILPDIDLTSIDPQISTSRRHARILRRGEVFYLQEEHATNGTLLNENRISAERPIEIRDGDTITFGAVRMRFAVD